MLGDDYIGNKMNDNTLKMSKDERFAFHIHQKVMIESVQLRGSYDAHMEVLIKLKSGVFVRVSRINGEDTFQIGAVENGKSKNPMPELKRQIPNKPLTCRDAFELFGKLHKKWPRYDQANCQTFAQTFMDELFPKTNLNLRLKELEEDFM